jgi:hypothetical protein
MTGPSPVNTRKPPALKPQEFVDYLTPDYPADDPVGHYVVVTWPDQLRGELEGAQRGITNKMPAHLATVWVWAAMVRTGLSSLKFDAFKETIVDLTEVKPDADEREAGEVDDPT